MTRKLSPRGIQPVAAWALGWLVAGAAHVFAAFPGPVPAPTDDPYGGPGPYSITTSTLPSPLWPGQVVTVKQPTDGGGPWPVWFVAHGFTGTLPVYYRELIDHLASHGAAVVFSPYPANLRVEENYDIMFAGFAAAVAAHAPTLDPSRLGVIGHSYGGGAVPALATRAVREHQWGSRGLALMILAPWYSFRASEAELAHLPAHAQLVMQVYSDDLINDHRMAVDLHRALPIPAANKTYLLVHSDRIDGYNYEAGHHVPTGAAVPRPGATFDALDAWAVLRIAQALARSAWFGESDARRLALGERPTETVAMGATPSDHRLREMERLEQPVAMYPSDRYNYRWSGWLNPRYYPWPDTTSSRLTNLSVRAFTGPGDEVLVAGALIAGDRAKSLLVRVVGPGLIPFGVDQTVSDPVLASYRGSTADVVVDDWAQAPNQDALTFTTEQVGAFTLGEESRDAALLATFPPGALSVHAQTKAAESGITLIEFYDAEVPTTTRLTNLSVRGKVGGGDARLIAGFVISGDTPLDLLIRGIGPGLRTFGLQSTLEDPRIEVLRGDEAVAFNDDWSTAAVGEAIARAGAFALAEGSADAALRLTLAPGVYSVHLTGVAAGDEGLGLLEVYELPRP